MAGLTNQQLHALQRAFDHAKNPNVPHFEFSPGGDVQFAPQLVLGTDNRELLDNPFFKAGWARCFGELEFMLHWILTATDQELTKYAGKPKRKRKKT